MSTSPILIQNFKTPLGELILGDYQHRLCLCDWKFRKSRAAIDKRIKVGLKTTFMEENSPLLEDAKSQLNHYFDKKLKVFDLPLLTIGTEFQKKVWDALLEIPFGETETYSGLSEKLGSPEAIRAIAMANGANAISIFIPCHRVVGKSGDLVGYAGGLPAKLKLLELEGVGFGKNAAFSGVLPIEFG